MIAKKKKVVDENLVSDECDPQLFKAGASLKHSTSNLPSQIELGMYRAWCA